MEANRIVRALIRDRAKLLGYIWAIVRDHHLAEDVFQDLTVLAMERAGEIQDDEHLLLWSRRAARYKALEVLRSKSYQATTLDDDVLELLQTDWARGDAFASSDEVDHLRACLERLTPHARRLVHLRYTEGLTGIQTAEVVQVKVHSVYVALARIHKALEECIRQRRHIAEVAHG
jgi:RNA polymerase sigma-70 factor (ECF subfamily)